MKQTQTVQVVDEFGVSLAAAQARKIARDVGFELLDRARVCAIVSSLATILGVGRERPGQVTVELVNGDGPPGVRIVYIVTSASRLLPEPEWLNPVRELADTLSVEQLMPGTIQVSAVMRLSQPTIVEA